jgi:hypothetical protein
MKLNLGERISVLTHSKNVKLGGPKLHLAKRNYNIYVGLAHRVS